MDFKIDTRDSFTIIVPQTELLDVNLAGSIAEQCLKTGQNGSGNYIVDLNNVTTIEAEALNSLIDLHEQMYSTDRSLVFTELQQQAWATVKENEADLVLNVAPKMIEAVDIISMEILERDLLGEE